MIEPVYFREEQFKFLSDARAYFKEKGIWRPCFDKRVGLGRRNEGTPYQFSDHWFYSTERHWDNKARGYKCDESLKLVLNFGENALPVHALVIYGGEKSPHAGLRLLYEQNLWTLGGDTLENHIAWVQQSIARKNKLASRGLECQNYRMDDRIRLIYRQPCNTLDELKGFTEKFENLNEVKA